MRHFLDFEKPIAALEGKIEELRHLGGDSGLNIADEIGKLQARIDKELAQTYQKLGPWEKFRWPAILNARSWSRSSLICSQTSRLCPGTGIMPKITPLSAGLPAFMAVRLW